MQYPGASDGRGFHAWLKAGRIVRKGQKGIKIVAPVMGGDGNAKVVNITPAWVFDVGQTDERRRRRIAPACGSMLISTRSGPEHHARGRCFHIDNPPLCPMRRWPQTATHPAPRRSVMARAAMTDLALPA